MQHGAPIVPRQTRQLLIEYHFHFLPGYIRRFLVLGKGGTLLATAAPFSCDFGVVCHALGNAIEPAGHRFLFANTSCSFRQQEEGSLKGVFDVLSLLQYSPTNPKHHGSMTAHELAKGSLVLLAGEAFEQFPVGHGAAGGMFDELADFAKDTVR